MITKISMSIMLVLILLAFATSCKKDNNNTTTPTNSRLVKYEITGNFTGKLTIIYNDNVNGNTVVNDVSLPWTKDITYASNVIGIGIGANGSTNGIAGQTATLKIYSGGTVVQTSTATVNASGGISLPTLAYVFP